MPLPAQRASRSPSPAQRAGKAPRPRRSPAHRANTSSSSRARFVDQSARRTCRNVIGKTPCLGNVYPSPFMSRWTYLRPTPSAGPHPPGGGSADLRVRPTERPSESILLFLDSPLSAHGGGTSVSASPQPLGTNSRSIPSFTPWALTLNIQIYRIDSAAAHAAYPQLKIKSPSTFVLATFTHTHGGPRSDSDTNFILQESGR